MIWSIYLRLGSNMWFHKFDTLVFDDEAWEKTVEKAHEIGINQIVLDLGEGMQYGSHPELSVPDAWSRQRIHEEIRKLREMGIELIPKLNFSATHALWLGEYRRMMSTSVYYKVCRNLINEVYTVFEQPTYIHLGMDEEDDPQFFDKMDLVVYRRGELLWHDLQFLCDCVRDLGATPWIWADPCFVYPEEFRKHIQAKDIVLQPWYYYAIKKEHYTPIESTQRQIEYYSQEPYKSMNLTYVEQDPFALRFFAQAISTANDYKVVPCISNCFECRYNADDMFDYFSKEAPAENVLGFMTAPWCPTTIKGLPRMLEALEIMKQAREKYYPGK